MEVSNSSREGGDVNEGRSECAALCHFRTRLPSEMALCPTSTKHQSSEPASVMYILQPRDAFEMGLLRIQLSVNGYPLPRLRRHALAACGLPILSGKV
jgi:hypothetical protein